MKKLFLTGIAALSVFSASALASAVHAGSVAVLPGTSAGEIAKILHQSNLALKCEEITVSAPADGKLDITGLPDGIFSMFSVKNNEIYFAGRRCESVQFVCGRQRSC